MDVNEEIDKKYNEDYEENEEYIKEIKKSLINLNDIHQVTNYWYALHKNENYKRNSKPFKTIPEIEKLIDKNKNFINSERLNLNNDVSKEYEKIILNSISEYEKKNDELKEEIKEINKKNKILRNYFGQKQILKQQIKEIFKNNQILEDEWNMKIKILETKIIETIREKNIYTNTKNKFIDEMIFYKDNYSISGLKDVLEKVQNWEINIDYDEFNHWIRKISSLDENTNKSDEFQDKLTNLLGSDDKEKILNFYNDLEKYYNYLKNDNESSESSESLESLENEENEENIQKKENEKNKKNIQKKENIQKKKSIFKLLLIIFTILIIIILFVFGIFRKKIKTIFVNL